MAVVTTPPPLEVVVTLAPRPVGGAQVRGVRGATAVVGALLSRSVLEILGLELIAIEGIEPCESEELTEATSGAAGTTPEGRMGPGDAA